MLNSRPVFKDTWKPSVPGARAVWSTHNLEHPHPGAQTPRSTDFQSPLEPEAQGTRLSVTTSARASLLSRSRAVISFDQTHHHSPLTLLPGHWSPDCGTSSTSSPAPPIAACSPCLQHHPRAPLLLLLLFLLLFFFPPHLFPLPGFPPSHCKYDLCSLWGGKKRCLTPPSTIFTFLKALSAEPAQVFSCFSRPLQGTPKHQHHPFPLLIQKSSTPLP